MTALSTVELVFAFTVSSVLSGDAPALLTALGGVAILAGVLAIAAETQVTKHCATACRRQSENSSSPVQKIEETNAAFA